MSKPRFNNGDRVVIHAPQISSYHRKEGVIVKRFRGVRSRRDIYKVLFDRLYTSAFYEEYLMAAQTNAPDDKHLEAI